MSTGFLLRDLGAEDPDGVVVDEAVDEGAGADGAGAASGL